MIRSATEYDIHPKANLGIAGNNEVVVSTANLGKVYRIYDQPQDRLKLMLFARFGRTYGREFWALRNVSFQVRRGESLGIIGRNGSGKSTLLQLIAGTLTPSEGLVEVNGRVAALLELGSGFNPEFTGRENVFLNGMILGLSRAEMEERFDEIAAFADIGTFLDQPVKTYSSGMVVRLAFSVQVAIRPDLLIVDEALAVGDIFFQAKCFKLLRKKLDSGMTLLFVSHALETVKQFCKHSLLLNAGQPAYFGSSAAAVSRFHEIIEGKAPGRDSLHLTASPLLGPENTKTVVNSALEQDLPRHKWFNWQSDDVTGSGEVEIIHCKIMNELGEVQSSFQCGEAILMTFFIKANCSVTGINAGVTIHTATHVAIYGLTTLHQEAPSQSLEAGEIASYRFHIPGRLGPGDYLIDFGLGKGDRGDGAPLMHLQRVGNIATFNVGALPWDLKFMGLTNLEGRVEFRR
jgi:lipopolysaccharide transport system ATP-binding protein